MQGVLGGEMQHLQGPGLFPKGLLGNRVSGLAGRVEGELLTLVHVAPSRQHTSRLRWCRGLGRRRVSSGTLEESWCFS